MTEPKSECCGARLIKPFERGNYLPPKACPDYDKAMRTLFPEAFIEEEIDITPLINWKTYPGGTKGGYFLEGSYAGKQIAFVNPAEKYDKENGFGIQILPSKENAYKMVWFGGHTFKIVKKRGNNE